MSIESEQTEDDFQKELVELFGQEAQEWLLQIHSALNELEHQPDLDRHTQLVDAIVEASPVLAVSCHGQSPDVERATFALLPFIDTVKDRTTATKQDTPQSVRSSVSSSRPSRRQPDVARSWNVPRGFFPIRACSRSSHALERAPNPSG